MGRRIILIPVRNPLTLLKWRLAVPGTPAGPFFEKPPSLRYLRRRRQEFKRSMAASAAKDRATCHEFYASSGARCVEVRYGDGRSFQAVIEPPQQETSTALQRRLKGWKPSRVYGQSAS